VTRGTENDENFILPPPPEVTTGAYILAIFLKLNYRKKKLGRRIFSSKYIPLMQKDVRELFLF